MLRLYTFTISHFSEKARWGLDFAGLDFIEKRLLPGPHVFVTRRLAPKSEVPILEHDGVIIQGSSAILDHLENKLGASRLSPPAGRKDDVAGIEASTDKAFGRGIQRILYDVLLHHRATVVDMWTQDGPVWGRAFYALGFGAIAMVLRRNYKIYPKAVEEAKDRFRGAFDELDARLARHPYLLGDAPCRVDVSVAALLAPLCRPPEHLLRWPEFPPEAKPFVSEFEGRPTWDFVRRMYREHRQRQS